MPVLPHNPTCTSPQCSSAYCTKNKGLSKHGSQCQVKVAGGCRFCKGISALLQLRARQYKADTCPTSYCTVIRGPSPCQVKKPDAKPAKTYPIPVANKLSGAQSRERHRDISRLVAILLDSATCTFSKCQSVNCTQMKGLLKHGFQCQVKVAGGCRFCKGISILLQRHARQCNAKTCPVPQCMAIREHLLQLKKLDTTSAAK
jgi:hypothetical protein